MSDGARANAQFQAATLEWIERFAPYGVIATDRELRVRSWNQWMEHHSGKESATVLGQKLTDIFPDLERRRFMGQFERALQGEVSVVSTALHGCLIRLPPVIKELSIPYMKQTARIAPLMTGQEIHGVLIVIEDVTQREWQAEILSRQQARDEMLAWALAQLMKADDPRRVIREVFCKVAEHLDFDSYLLHLYEPDTAGFKLHASGGVDPENEAAIQRLEAHALPWITDATERQAIVREHVALSNDPRFAIAQRLGYLAYVVLPLITGSTLLGLLTFATRTRDTIAANETELLTTIAQYLAVALNREKTDRELRVAQKKLNEHAQELEKRVAERTASLQQTIAELQTFSYTIAHDLRAPIRALNGYCEVLLEDHAENIPPEAAALLNRLRKSSTQMDALTRDLLEFSKVSRQDLKLTAIDLSELVTETVLMGGSRISSVTHVQLPLHTVIANRTLVGQCVSNLLENALKFCRPGIPPAIRIWSESTTETPHASEVDFSPARYSLAEPPAGEMPPRGSSRVRLWVADNGIGISAQAQRKVFGIFERGDAAGDYEGTGIGLAIVARAMERMGGSCGVESKVDEGSCFWLEFNA